MVSRLDQIYYRQELNYLEEQGKQFAERYPEIAHYLGLAGSDPSLRDPHAERIVEAFAFLMGRYTRFREAQYPKFVQSLFQMIHPQYLRAQPCKSAVAFSAKESMIDKPVLVPRGTELYADHLGPNNERYTFTTCWDVWVQPVLLERVYYDPEMPGDYGISLKLRAHSGTDLTVCNWDNLEFTLQGEPTTRAELYLLLAEFCTRVALKDQTGTEHQLGLKLSGFDLDHDYNEAQQHQATGLQYLRDYFDNPMRFQCFRITGLQAWMQQQKDLTNLQIDIGFSRPFPPGVRITDEHIRLHCTVAQNLFALDCHPLTVEADALEHLIHPDGNDRDDLEVRDIQHITASQNREMHEVRPYYSFNRADKEQARQLFYAQRLDTAVENGWDTYLRLLDLNHSGPGALADYTLSIRALCTNRRHAEKLKIGQLNRVSTEIPETISATNISLPTKAAWPPLHSREEWDFLAHLALDYSELASVEVLKTLLTLYCIARDDAGLRRIRGIRKVRDEQDYIIKKGACLPGRCLRVSADVNHFSGLGDLALFTRVLGHFLHAYCPINGFIRLVVTDSESKTSFEFTAWG